jgi:hypothetical protein
MLHRDVSCCCVLSGPVSCWGFHRSLSEATDARAIRVRTATKGTPNAKTSAIILLSLAGMLPSTEPFA